MYGASPFFIFEKIDLLNGIKLIGGICIQVLIIWAVHLYLEIQFPHQNIFWRFILGNLVSAVLRLPILLIIPLFSPLIPNLAQKYLAYPIVTSLAVNIIVMVIVQSTVNGYKKMMNEKQIQELKWQNVVAQKQMLMQQLQPHFLFNALSVLKSLIIENPEKAENYTLQLSDFLRYTVQSSNKELATLAEELQFVKAFINLQKIRFDEAFVATISVKEEYEQRKIPVLALQLLVENIFKHNYFTPKKPLHFSIVADENTLTIRNEKTSPKLTEKNNTGLKNLNIRYQLISNQGIEIVDSEHEFVVKIPLLNP